MLAQMLTCLAMSLGQAQPFPVAPATATQPATELGAILAVGSSGPQNAAAQGQNDGPPAKPMPPAKGTPETLPQPNVDNGKDDKNGKKEEVYTPGFLRRLFKAYKDEFTKDDDRWKKKRDEQKAAEGKDDEKKDSNGNGGDSTPTPERRAAPSPWTSPPFPGHEYQGYPLIGVPKDTTVYPLMQAINGIPVIGDCIKDSGFKLYGWVDVSGNYSTSHNSNTPASYWIVPNRFELDQAVLRLEREVDSVQTDHVDIGGRLTATYGIDYRYLTAGGWFSDQLLLNNRLYGFDPTEVYADIYIPYIMEGVILRVGRWVACPDIETQFAPDNYLGSHSILFTYDTYTQTGALLTMRPAERWLFQLGYNAGNDMAPWYQGAVVCGFIGLRWVSQDNNDSVYTCLNQIDNAQFRHFEVNGQPAGHDNFNYIVSTWEHRFSEWCHTKTEGYFMWERNGEIGGTPSLGPVEPYGGGGGDGVLLPGMSLAYGILNYTMFALNTRDYITVRNEWYRDERGMRTGFAGNYSSHTIGISHQFNDYLMLRPELGYYRNWTQDAFDNGNSKGMLMGGFDLLIRF